MPTWIQHLIVGIIVALCTGIALRNIILSIKNKGKNKCGSCTAECALRDTIKAKKEDCNKKNNAKNLQN